MVCHVDFSMEAIQLFSPPLSDSEIDKKVQLPLGRGGGLYKSCDVITFCQQVLRFVSIYLHF